MFLNSQMYFKTIACRNKSVYIVRFWRTSHVFVASCKRAFNCGFIPNCQDPGLHAVSVQVLDKANYPSGSLLKHYAGKKTMAVILGLHLCAQIGIPQLSLKPGHTNWRDYRKVYMDDDAQSAAWSDASDSNAPPPFDIAWPCVLICDLPSFLF